MGPGGFSVVLEAVDVRTKEAVAVKVLTEPTTDAAAEFANEGRLLEKVKKTSNVVRLHDTGHAQVPMQSGHVTMPISFNYHVLELAQECLETLVLDRDRLSWVERLKLWRGCVRGVHQLHCHDVAHRDLKSSNCLVFERPRNSVETKVSDLGRSRDLNAPAVHDPIDYLAGRGDLRFAAPEFIALQGDDSRSAHLGADLYGLGSLLYELVTGQCITSVALGFGPTLVRTHMQLWQQGQSIDLSGMRAEYEHAYQIFDASVPPVIRPVAASLIRQICDPDPSARFPKARFGRQGKNAQSGLEWLLTRADIMARTLAAQDAQNRRLAMRKGA